MIDARPIQNSEDTSAVVAALLSNADAHHNQASVLFGDVRRLYRKIDSTHRAADNLHRKIRTTHARIRTLRSEDRLGRRKWNGRSLPKGL